MNHETSNSDDRPDRKQIMRHRAADCTRGQYFLEIDGGLREVDYETWRRTQTTDD